ncbi:MAG: hypothetical protein ABEJ70_00335 [Halobacteriaceae archaeon]
MALFDDDEPERERAPDAPSVDGPDVDVPSVDPPSVDVPDGADAPRELQVAFWSLVLQFNLALLGLSLGAMLVGFRGEYLWGGVALLVGLFALLRGYRGYRHEMARDAETGEDED